MSNNMEKYYQQFANLPSKSFMPTQIINILSQHEQGAWSYLCDCFSDSFGPKDLVAWPGWNSYSAKTRSMWSVLLMSYWKWLAKNGNCDLVKVNYRKYTWDKDFAKRLEEAP